MRISIEAPDGMKKEDAQKCFLIGMKTYLMCNNAGLCVSHGTDEQGSPELKMLSFRGEYAAAMLRFCEALDRVRGTDREKALQAMRSEGSKVLREIQKKGERK